MRLHDSTRFGLLGRRALVTGASAGIGFGIAHMLGEAGARVALVARNAAALDEACDKLGALGIDAVPLAADLLDPEEVDRVVDRAVEAIALASGPFDGLAV